MRAPAPPAGRASWIALAATAVLAAGIGVALHQTRMLEAPPPVPGGEPGERTIERALESAPSGGTQPAPPDSTAIKRRWQDDVRGIDVSGLDPARRELFLRFANAQNCTCGCGYTLAGCRASDMTCDVSGERLASLLDSVRTGRITRARGVRARPAAGP